MGENEERIITILKNAKIEFCKGEFINVGVHEIKTSIDFKFFDNKTTYYIEVDSYNMTKCLLGQYILLNYATLNKTKIVFVVIHFYKGYNIERTIKHLKFAKKELYCTIPFAVFHIKDLPHGKKEIIKRINEQINNKNK